MNKIISAASAILLSLPVCVNAQTACDCYQVVPQVTYRPTNVVNYRLVQETVYEKQQVTSYKPVWVTEKRERRTTVLRPIKETSERVEEYTVSKPIVETAYEERTYEETILETVTEMRDQEYVVERPITETTYQERTHVVRKPVTETIEQSEQVTVMRPQTSIEQRYATANVPSSQWVLRDGGYTWPRLQRFSAGYYPDPNTGALVYQRGGLRWTQTPRPDYYQAQNTVTPTLVPYSVEQTTLVPETVTVQKPVTVTRYVDEVVTEKIPVTSQTVQREVVTRKVPVTVQRPTKRIVTEKVPVQKVRYESQIVTRKTPVTTITYEEVEQVEPYEVQVLKYVAESKEIEVPRTVTRRVPLVSSSLVPETRYYRVPVSASTAADPLSGVIESSLLPSVVDRPVGTRTEVYYGTPVITTRPANSTDWPESKVETAKPATNLTDVESPKPPAVEDNRSGKDSVEAQRKEAEPTVEADRQPSLNGGK